MLRPLSSVLRIALVRRSGLTFLLRVRMTLLGAIVGHSITPAFVCAREWFR